MWKSRLQEYCQKKGYKLPLYSTVPYIDCVQAILYVSTVTVEIDDILLSNISFPCTSKREAESNAAYILYSNISQRNYYKTLCLIDLENVHYFSKSLKDDVLYIGFLTSNHSTLSKYDAWKSPSTKDIIEESSNTNTLLYTIEGGEKNLVDHYLSSFVTEISSYIKKIGEKVNVYILTSDNAGWCSRRCLEADCKMNKISDLITITNSRELK